MAQPSLLHYLDLDRMANYISLKVAMQQSPHTMDNVLDTTQLVIHWCMAQPGGSHPSIQKATSWMQTLSKQVRTLQQRCTTLA